MALLRSKSAPQVAAQTFSALHFTASAQTHVRHSKIQRHASALAITTLSSTPVYRASTHSGHQTPRAERVDDPFSLAGFFPASLAGVSEYERTTHMEWDWLHYEVDDQEGVVGKRQHALEHVPTPTRSGYASPTSSEEEEWAMPATPPLTATRPMFDRGEDEVCGETIRREDKLGILSLPNPFVLAESSDVLAQGPLLSPYSEDNPCDSDALYNALCALRTAHAKLEGASLSGSAVVGRSGTCSGGLFSSGEEERVVDSDLETLGTRGLGRLLDMLPL